MAKCLVGIVQSGRNLTDFDILAMPIAKIVDRCPVERDHDADIVNGFSSLYNYLDDTKHKYLHKKHGMLELVRALARHLREDPEKHRILKLLREEEAIEQKKLDLLHAVAGPRLQTSLDAIHQHSLIVRDKKPLSKQQIEQLQLSKLTAPEKAELLFDLIRLDLFLAFHSSSPPKMRSDVVLDRAFVDPAYYRGQMLSFSSSYGDFASSAFKGFVARKVELDVLVFPESYEEARRERADRIRRLELGRGPDGDRGKKLGPGFGHGEPNTLRLGVDTKLPVTGALQEGLRNPHDLARPVPFGQKAGLPLLEGSSGKLISEASRVAGRIDFRKGSVIAGTATGLLLATTVVAIALEHDLPPSEVAAAMGIDLKSIAEGLAQSAAEDAAVSVLVGALASSTGPGAPVAAAVAQVIRQGYKLYQSGEDLADTYQLLHLLVTEIDHGKVLGKLGDSAAEQLGIATEDLNDFLYGESPEIDWRATEKAARAALGNDRQKQIEFGQDLVLSRDANKDRELFVDKYLPFVVFEGRSDEERGHQQLAPGSDGSVEPEAIVAPKGDVDDGALQPVLANPLDVNREGSRKIDKEDPFARKTSYDRYQRQPLRATAERNANRPRTDRV